MNNRNQANSNTFGLGSHIEDEEPALSDNSTIKDETPLLPDSPSDESKKSESDDSKSVASSSSSSSSENTPSSKKKTLKIKFNLEPVPTLPQGIVSIDLLGGDKDKEMGSESSSLKPAPIVVSVPVIARTPVPVMLVNIPLENPSPPSER